jgi:hypothetical protein
MRSFEGLTQRGQGLKTRAGPGVMPIIRRYRERALAICDRHDAGLYGTRAFFALRMIVMLPPLRKKVLSCPSSQRTR